MDLETIYKLAEEDTKIDMTQLDVESLKVSSVHNKYLKILSGEILRLKTLQTQRSEIVKDKWLYYMGKAPDAVYAKEPFDLKITRSEVDVFIDGDKAVIEINTKINYQQEKVKYLEELIKGINNRNWNIRNAIEFHKFKNGIG